jgi:hypothetical protein
VKSIQVGGFADFICVFVQAMQAPPLWFVWLRQLKTLSQRGEKVVPKFIIEREIPGIGKPSAEQLSAMSRASCAAIEKVGPQLQWSQSYVTEDKLYCVYISPDEEDIREHARLSNIPANRISRVMAIIDPTSAE